MDEGTAARIGSSPGPGTPDAGGPFLPMSLAAVTGGGGGGPGPAPSVSSKGAPVRGMAGAPAGAAFGGLTGRGEWRSDTAIVGDAVGGEACGNAGARGPGGGGGRGKVAIARLSGELREYEDWLDGVEPAWTVLEPARWEALMREPSPENGAVRLAVDLTDAELAQSAMVRNALVLLGAAAGDDGLKLTARGNLTRPVVSAMREAMDWPGCAYEERRRAGKALSEGHVGELRLVRALLEEAGFMEAAGGRLRASRRGYRLLAGPKGALQATLFRIAFWRVSLNLFGAAECGSWPQQQVGAALWALSTTGDRLQDTSGLMKLAVLPDAAVKSNPAWVAPVLFAWRVLRPLWWFGLVECDEDGEDLEAASWRKSVLFDRFLGFDTDLVRTEGSLH